MFYQKPVALNPNIHGDLTVGPSPSGYRFAAEAQSILLATSEFFDAGRQFPIIFTKSEDERIFPLALMGLEQKENLFVGDDGQWQGLYVPAYIRRYPFITTDEIDGRMVVFVDEAYDGFNQKGGALLFEEGQPSAKLKEIQSFLQRYYVQLKQTEQFASSLAEAGLLTPIDAQASLNDGRKYALRGMQAVDEAKLTQMSDVEIVKLFRTGGLGLIHAHLLSLRNLAVLVDRKARQDHAEAGSP